MQELVYRNIRKHGEISEMMWEMCIGATFRNLYLIVLLKTLQKRANTIEKYLTYGNLATAMSSIV